MVASTRSDLRSVLAGILVLLLTFTGVGRGVAGGLGPTDLRASTFGVVAPICHAGPAAPGPDRPVDPDCCTACALLAAAVLPAAPELYRPPSIPVPVPRVVAVAPVPSPARTRSPRQAQGPPLGA